MFTVTCKNNGIHCTTLSTSNLGIKESTEHFVDRDTGRSIIDIEMWIKQDRNIENTGKDKNLKYHIFSIVRHIFPPIF